MQRTQYDGLPRPSIPSGLTHATALEGHRTSISKHVLRERNNYMTRSRTLLITCLMLFGSLPAGCSKGPYVPMDMTADRLAVLEIRANLDVASTTDAQVDTATLAQPTGFATLKGVFVLDGAAPSNPTLTISKDVQVCMPGRVPVKDKVVITGPGGGLANVLVYAVDIPDAWAHESMIGSTDTIDFDQKDCLFLNRIFPMQTSQRLKILNSDRVGHNTDMKPSKNLPINPNSPGGGYVTYPTEGVALKEEKAPFSVSCGAHPWMKSYMIFRKNGYFAVTAEDGSFQIPLLPAGVDLKISVWHEASRFIRATAVEVDPSIAKGWSKRGSFTINLAPDSETDLQVAVSSSALTK